MTPDQTPGPHPDDDVRAMLERRADSVQPGDGYPAIQRKLAQAPAGHRLWGANPALVAVAAVLALLVGAGVVALAARGNDHQGVNTIDQPPSSTALPATTTTTTIAPPTTPTTIPPTQVPTTVLPIEPLPTTSPPTTEPSTTTATTTTTTTTTAPEPVTPITSSSTVSVDSIGPITLPISRTDFEARTGQKLTPRSGDFPGSSCDYTRIVGGPDNVIFMTEDDRLVRLDSSTSESGLPPIRTTEGIGAGTTRAEVLAAYPGAVARQSVYDMPELIVTDPARPGYKLNFGLTDDEVTGLIAGIDGFVDYPEGCA